MKKIISGIQTSGDLHLGNYLGAIKNWLALQDSHECFFFLADMHAITVPQDPKSLRENTRKTAATYIGCGVDTSKSLIFHQSAVSEHAELAWILSCITSMGWMNRMTQFKDKAGKDREKASLGLYSYPVLMAADILIYNVDAVPVGDDQKQHLELTRNIAADFNRTFDIDFFKIPEPMINGAATRVMSLKDGSKKMSKSDPSANSRINLTDSTDQIVKKIKKATTDSIGTIAYDKNARPEISNLMSIYSAISGDNFETIENNFVGKTYAEFKKKLIEIIVAEIKPISREINILLKDPATIDKILLKNARIAKEHAAKTLDEVKRIIGFLP
jgi:tryptophanyl-tRNA synthetase